MQIKIFPFLCTLTISSPAGLIPAIGVCILRTVAEKTLRKWKAGAGTGSGRTQAKRSNDIQI